MLGAVGALAVLGSGPGLPGRNPAVSPAKRAHRRGRSKDLLRGRQLPGFSGGPRPYAVDPVTGMKRRVDG